MSQKIAIISDIHGNETALEAVLADAQTQKPTGYWFLGDYLMPGPATSQILNQIKECHPQVCLRGNWEGILLDAASGRLPLIDATHLYLDDLSHYQLQHLQPEELAWLDDLPIAEHIESEGLRFNLSHHLPTKSWGRELVVTENQDQFDRLFEAAPAEVAIFGHIHQQMMRYGSDGQLILNPGSVSQPFHLNPAFQKDLRAQYALLEFDQTGIRDVHFRRIDYAVGIEVERAKASNVPYLELYIESLKTGKIFTYETTRLEQVRKQENI